MSIAHLCFSAMEAAIPLCRLFYPFDLEMSITTISLFLIMTLNKNIVPMEHESRPFTQTVEGI
jgi:hypothetical protein